jgi:hypothetical protein
VALGEIGLGVDLVLIVCLAFAGRLSRGGDSLFLLAQEK